MHTAVPYASASRTFVIDLDTKILNQMKMIDEWRGYMKALADLRHVFPEVARENAFQEALNNVRLEGATIDTERARTMLANGDAPRDQAESEFLNYHRLIESMDSFAGTPGRPKEAFRETDIRQFHAEFVRIHPFVDGNGRTARFLASVVLLQHGYDFRSLFCVTEYYNAHRERYSAALHSVDLPSVRHHVEVAADGRPGVRTETVYDASAWVRYFLGGLARQMKACEERVKSAPGTPAG